jgi:hypothetical protein
METTPPSLFLAWLKTHFKSKRKGAVDYERAAAAFTSATGCHAKPDTLRHVARAYKRPGGPLAASIQAWTKHRVDAAALLSWCGYSRDPERA